MAGKKNIHTILLIDDDEEDFLIFSEAVKKVAPEIKVYHLSTCPSNTNGTYFPENPDLLFLDINMPAHDGYYWLEKIREKGMTELPVIIYSTTEVDTHINKAYQLGANLFLSKPQCFNKLVAALETIFQYNWQQPQSVTDAHYSDGRYHSFSYA